MVEFAIEVSWVCRVVCGVSRSGKEKAFGAVVGITSALLGACEVDEVCRMSPAAIETDMFLRWRLL